MPQKVTTRCRPKQSSATVIIIIKNVTNCCYHYQCLVLQGTAILQVTCESGGAIAPTKAVAQLLLVGTRNVNTAYQLNYFQKIYKVEAKINMNIKQAKSKRLQSVNIIENVIKKVIVQYVKKTHGTVCDLKKSQYSM